MVKLHNAVVLSNEFEVAQEVDLRGRECAPEACVIKVDDGHYVVCDKPMCIIVDVI